MRAPLAFLLIVGIFIGGGYAGFVWLANPSTSRHEAPSRPLPAGTALKANMPSEADRTVQENASKGLAAVDESVAAREANNVAQGIPLPTRRDEDADKGHSSVATSSPAQQAENDQSKANGSLTDQTGSTKAHDAPVGSCMPFGITAGGNLVFPMECRELLKQYRESYASVEARPQEPTAAVPTAQTAEVDHGVQTAASVPGHETVDIARDHDSQTVAGGSVDDQKTANTPSTDADVRTGANAVPRAKVKATTNSWRTSGEKSSRRGKVRQSSRALHGRQERLFEWFNDPLAFDCVNCLLFGY
jgi:hypothetical protein